VNTPAAKRIVTGLLIVAIAISGVIGLIAFFNNRDSSTTGGAGTQPAPGVAAPAGGGPLLQNGNVELRYSDPAFAPKLRALAASLGAPDTPALRAAGAAVVVRRDPKVGGVRANAWKHTLTVTSPADPSLQDFIESWLGRGASG
jgi:hypothetical protein